MAPDMAVAELEALPSAAVAVATRQRPDGGHAVPVG